MTAPRWWPTGTSASLETGPAGPYSILPRGELIGQPLHPFLEQRQLQPTPRICTGLLRQLDIGGTLRGGAVKGSGKVEELAILNASR